MENEPRQGEGNVMPVRLKLTMHGWFMVRQPRLTVCLFIPSRTKKLNIIMTHITVYLLKTFSAKNAIMKHGTLKYDTVATDIFPCMAYLL